MFNPYQRFSVDEALKHPYLRDFHNEKEEISLNKVIQVNINDNTKITIKEYRDAIYNDIV